jgi:hypothetical protein
MPDIANHDVLVVDDISRLMPEHMDHWEDLIGRLCSHGMKLLLWGGLELATFWERISAATTFSPFHSLEVKRLGRYTESEVKALLDRHSRKVVANAADVLYSVTNGIPPLVIELIDRLSPELRQGNYEGLLKRALETGYLRWLGNAIMDSDQFKEILLNMTIGDMSRRNTVIEDQLEWLGVVVEDDPGVWQWTAPAVKEWIGMLPL